MEVAVIGAGPAGLFAAYEYARFGAHVTVYDRGFDLRHRKCPDVHCPTCFFNTNCGILCGEGGAGGYSDGKLTLSTGRGVQTGNELNFAQYEKELQDVATICETFGPKPQIWPPIERPDLLKNSAFEFESFPLVFYGTGGIRQMFHSMITHMKKIMGVTFIWQADIQEVVEIPSEDGQTMVIMGITPEDGYSSQFYDYVVLASGSHDTTLIRKIAVDNEVTLDHGGPAGVGIRLEAHDFLLAPIMSKFYDFKLYLESPLFGELIQYRSFCVNKGGAIVNEQHLGPDGPIVSINGRAEIEPTGRSNLAILAKVPSGKAYVRSLAVAINKAGAGLPVYQSAKSFLGHRAFTGEAVSEFARQNASHRDLASILPGDLTRGFQKYIVELDRILPGLLEGPDTLIYAPEIKYHMPRWPLGAGFTVKGVPGLQVIGNAAGYTDSISTAATMGLVAARHHFYL